MRTVQDIVFGVSGQQVYLDCTEGRPSSVTSVEVFWWDSDDDSPTLSGTGSVETNPNTTLDAASGSDQVETRIINLTATTGIETGRNYLITAAAGHREWTEVASISSGAYVVAKHPLHNAYAAADTFQTTRITATLDSDWLSDETNLDDTNGPNPSHRVRWVYVVSGTTYVADSYFSLVRYAGRHGVKPQDVESISPGWMDRLPTDHYSDQGKRLIEEANRAVKIDLHQIWTDDAMVAQSEVIDELTRYRCLEMTELARIMSGGGSQTAYDAARLAYAGRFDALAKITNKLPMRTTDASATPRTAMPLTRR